VISTSAVLPEADCLQGWYGSVNLLNDICHHSILGDPGAASWGDEIFTGKSLQQERESPWAFTLTERVPEVFEIPPSDWPSGQSPSGLKI